MTKIRQGLFNLLSNAAKFTENGLIKVTLGRGKESGLVEFSVKDEGIGMSKNVQKLIFDKFYREQKGNIHDVKGHGLGLAYVKEIVEKHHGTVFVESEKGKGSTFIIKLPLIS